MEQDDGFQLKEQEDKSPYELSRMLLQAISLLSIAQCKKLSNETKLWLTQSKEYDPNVIEKEAIRINNELQQASLKTRLLSKQAEKIAKQREHLRALQPKSK